MLLKPAFAVAAAFVASVAAQRTTSSSFSTTTSASRRSSSTTIRSSTTSSSSSRSSSTRSTAVSTSSVVASACARASAASSAYEAANPSATTVFIPATLAEDCLRSVPLALDEDIKLLEEYSYFLEWQSNTGWLARPPVGYNETRTDVLAGLKTLQKDLKDGKFKSEWDFQVTFRTIILTAYDNHFSWTPDMFSIFHFHRIAPSLRLVSTSADGKQLPQVYSYEDIMATANRNTQQISPVLRINGEDVQQYLVKYALDIQYHDKDARYNSLFVTHSGVGFQSGGNDFTNSPLPLGAATIVTYQNGTTRNFTNIASVHRSLEGITTGKSFFSTFCTGPSFEEASTLEARTLPWMPHKRDIEEEEVPVARGYPKPFLMHSTKSVAGYFLNGSDYNDTVVLVMPTFDVSFETGEEYRALIRDLFNNATAMGKTNLIIDLRGNGGGNPFFGTEVWKRLYPFISFPYDATRYRAFEMFETMGALVTGFLSNFTYQDALDDRANNTYGGAVSTAYESYWNYKLPWTTQDSTHFKSWDEYYGPFSRNGDNYTAINRNDVENPFVPNAPNITGYGAFKNDLGRPPFNPWNIVLLNDGQCSSACAAFSELMKTQGKAQVVTMGGLPQTGPMQAIGGTKGGWVHDLWSLQNFTTTALEVASHYLDNVTIAALESSKLATFSQLTQPIKRSWDGSSVRARVNIQDSLRMGDSSETALEFIYEAADCRLFYTPGMIRDVTQVWKAVRDARWKDGYASCVAGSTKHPSSVSGGAHINLVTTNNPTNSSVNSTTTPFNCRPGLFCPSGAASRSSSWSGIAAIVAGIFGLVSFF